MLVLGSLAPGDIAVLVPLTDPGYSATGEIEDANPEPHLFLVAVNPLPPHVVEGGAAEFEVRLRDQDDTEDAPSAGEVTVDVATMDSTPASATSGDDYTALTEPLTFDSGDVLKMVTVQTLDDPFAEPDETFELVLLQNAAGAGMGGSSVTVTILDNEATVSVAAAEADEGETLEFELRVVWPDPAVVPTPFNVVVTYQLVAYTRAANDAIQGSACGGDADYLLPSPATAMIAHPATTATIQVQTCHDTLVEPDEQFWLQLSTVNDAVAVPAHPENGAVGTILNDDIPVVSVSPAEAEGIEGQDPLVFTVSLTVDSAAAQLTEDVTVNYTVRGSGENGADPATDPGEPGADYAVTLDGTALSDTALGGTLTFTAETPGTPAVTEFVFKMELLADYEPENDETLRLELTNPSRAGLFDGNPDLPEPTELVAVATIKDDPPPTLSVEGFTDSEGTTQSCHFRGPRGPPSPSRSRWPTPARGRRRRWTTPSRPARPIRLMRATTTRLFCRPT